MGRGWGGALAVSGGVMGGGATGTACAWGTSTGGSSGDTAAVVAWGTAGVCVLVVGDAGCSAARTSSFGVEGFQLGIGVAGAGVATDADSGAWVGSGDGLGASRVEAAGLLPVTIAVGTSSGVVDRGNMSSVTTCGMADCISGSAVEGVTDALSIS